MAAFSDNAVTSLAIEGVLLVDFTIHVDTRGLVYEMIHASDAFVPRIGQVYHVLNPRADTIRAFHAHQELHDWFHIVHGSALFCLVDSRHGADAPTATVRVVLTDRKPQLLVVPPGVYHGWMSLEPDTVLTSVANTEYRREQPDEHRVPPDHFDQLFGGSPWRVDAR